jgi:hypothetical protein
MLTLGDDETTVYVTSPAATRRISLAFDARRRHLLDSRASMLQGRQRRLASDWRSWRRRRRWLRIPPPGIRCCIPLLDVTTSLDPRFNVACGSARPFSRSPIQLVPAGRTWPWRSSTRVCAHGPTSGNTCRTSASCTTGGHDYREAANWFDKASRVAGAPWWLKSLAATTLAQGGDRQSSRQMWAAIRESAEIDWLKQDADRRLAQLLALDEIDRLQQAVETVAGRAGQRPTDWRSLSRAGVMPGVPVDPAGSPYDFGSDGKVRLSRASPLWPPPDEPRAESPRPLR